jgi:long-subunit acyl-CoA synthetase (AMP-forming)
MSADLEAMTAISGGFKEMHSTLALEPYERSIGALLRDRARELAERPLLKQVGKSGSYETFTWKVIFDQIVNLGANLLAHGIRPGDRLAILSENREEMLVSELAAMSIGCISVPIFAGYFPETIDFIVSHCGARYLTVSTLPQLMKLTECDRLSGLETIMFMDYGASKLNLRAIGAVPVRPFHDLLVAPSTSDIAEFHKQLEAVAGENSCLIMYTSGTTGQPKGVELTHNNLISQQRAIRQLWGLGPDERFLSCLPWHHSFGGLFERFMALYSGSCLALDESGGKDIDLLISNWEKVLPTVFFSVPAIFQKLDREIRNSERVRKLIFHGRLRFVFTAAAPLPAYISQLFSEAGVPVLEGWGLTETSPCVTLTNPHETRVPGVVGTPIPGVTIRLDGHGEIQVSGVNVMKGYYNAPDLNKQCFTEDGWLKTGDLGEVHPLGLRIAGRSDGMFKLMNAEKVYASQIEMALIEGSPYIDHAVVTGSGQHYVCALIYANHEALVKWSQEHGITTPEGDDIAAVSEIRSLFAKEVQRINGQIAGRFQRIRKFMVLGRPLSFEKGELTPTSKVVRKKVLENRHQLVESLFQADCPPAQKTIVCLGDCY